MAVDGQDESECVAIVNEDASSEAGSNSAETFTFILEAFAVQRVLVSDLC